VLVLPCFAPIVDVSHPAATKVVGSTRPSVEVPAGFNDTNGLENARDNGRAT
jgi:hypothetical protein